MRVIIEFQTENGLILPVQHNHLIQGFIYRSISDGLADMLHDRGFLVEKRRFKLFTFSRIQGRFRLDKKKNTIIFDSPFKLIISSALNQFVEELGKEMVIKDSLKIGRNTLRINTIKISKNEPANKNRIKMLSPVTVYSTLKKADGKKKTYYYSPFEEDFSRLISENAKKNSEPFIPMGVKKSHPEAVLNLSL